MNDYTEQIKRIKAKLREARKHDAARRVFGAERHRYAIKPPATATEVNEFENQYSIQLPSCYREFILRIGNGGVSYRDSAAGPNYGIYPLGRGVDDLAYERTKEFLVKECILHPEMTDEYWKNLCAGMMNDKETVPDEVFEVEQGTLFAGILPIGSQGCTYLSGIVLNGPHKGRVVSLDLDRQKPFFERADNFLDWYENWLDAVIAGKLIR